jgi:two-component system CheB/CheR fusion protein
LRAANGGPATMSFEGKLLRQDKSIEVIATTAPLFNIDGHARGVIAAVVDISELRQVEAAREMLLHELQHRVKNILATVSSLAARMSKSGEDFTQSFVPRLAAMGKLHELLANGGWSGTDLKQLVMTAVSPQVGRPADSLSVTGPSVRLKPNATSTLGMVFHELATNAAKYGALSVAGGRVEVTWRRAHSGRNCLIIMWNESGGPRIAGSHAEGFGTGFLKRSVEFELAGEVDLQMPSDGVRCTITVPVDGNVEPSAAEDAHG